MRRYTKRAIIVIDARNLVAANASAKAVDTVGGEKTFHAGLSPTGSLPATHYWCNWALLPVEDTALRGGLSGLVAANRATVFDAATTTPSQVLQALSLKQIETKFS